ncbi:MAG: electron transfer flavoprotein subunit beta/FixA family protein [Synergistaceae bacterium]|nr:electron transfer flavoprotein subunit beta/FixA family protein [Synergistaceae bacterium]
MELGKTLKIAVLIKQVPATEHVKINPETGVMAREGLEVEVNPLDLHAIEEAVRIKEKLSARVTVVTMGPPAAVKAARYAIAMGCDEGVVVTDRAFAGSDTLATAGILTETLRKLGGFDLILAGERATDGETGQVGPAVGSLLGISVLTYVSKLEFQDDGVLVQRAVEGGHERLSAPLPALAVVVKEINVPRLCTLGGKLRGKRATIRTLSFEDLGLSREHVGLAGSPTKVVKVGYPQVTRKGRKVSVASDFDGAIGEFTRFLADMGAIGTPGLSPSGAKEARR